MAYNVDDIDEYGAVKPGVALMLSTIFLMRQVLYAPFSMLAKRKGMAGSGAEIDLSFIQIFSVWELLACMPAMLVMVALLKRKPEAGPFIRRISANARQLLLAAAGLQLTALLYVFIVQSVQSVFMLANIALSIYIFIYIFRSQRLRDVVNEFPDDVNNGQR